MAKDRFIPERKLITCNGCFRSVRVPLRITEAMLPVILICPRCQSEIKLEDIPQLPKVEVRNDIEDIEFIVRGNETISEDLNPDPNKGLVQDAISPLLTMREHADEMAKLLYSMFVHGECIVSQISRLEQQMQHVYAEQHRLAELFSTNWVVQGLKEFIVNPFATFPATAATETTTAYSRYVLSPRFFRPYLGFNYGQSGGCRLELINQYSRLHYPLNDLLCEYLQVPKNLGLKVLGNKLVGRDLENVYQDIPGITPDVDHTPEQASMMISKSFETRTWLANHAVHAWSEYPILPDEIYEYEKLENLTNSTYHLDIWEKLKACSRIVIFSDHLREDRSLIVLMLALIKGSKLILVSEEADQLKWRDHYTTGSLHFIRGHEFIYNSNEEHLTLEILRGLRVVVVDLTTPVDQEKIKLLYGYKGILVILGNDAMMDMMQENNQAKIIYGLVSGFFHGQNNLFYEEEADDVKLSQLDDHSLIKMFKELAK